MKSRTVIRSLVGALGLGVAAYASYAAWTWVTYGNKRRTKPAETGSLLDRFMPIYECGDRQHQHIPAPASATFHAVLNLDLNRSKVVRSLFKAREWILGSTAAEKQLPSNLIEQLTTLGWAILAEVPGCEIVLGAATQPWNADVVFRTVPRDEFAVFIEPDYVKIVVSIRVDPLGLAESIAYTETRASATSGAAREKFRVYWALFSPGILLIRKILLRRVRHEALASLRAGTTGAVVGLPDKA